VPDASTRRRPALPRDRSPVPGLSPPLDWGSLLGYLAARATPGIEAVDAGGRYWRSIRLHGHLGYIAVGGRGTRVPSAGSDSLAQTISYEVTRFGIETSIVIPGAFTGGTAHFPNAGHPSDADTVAKYDRYDGLLDQVGARLSALTPDTADPQVVAEEIARIVGLPAR